MELILFVYFIGIAENLKLGISMFLAALAIFLFFGASNMYHEVNLKFLSNLFDKLTSSKLFFAFTIFLIFLLIFVPNKNTMISMGGAYDASQEYTAAKESPILQKSLKLIENKIDENLKNSEESLKGKE